MGKVVFHQHSWMRIDMLLVRDKAVRHNAVRDKAVRHNAVQSGRSKKRIGRTILGANHSWDRRMEESDHCTRSSRAH
jgi:hypothetical protein